MDNTCWISWNIRFMYLYSNVFFKVVFIHGDYCFANSLGFPYEC